MQVARLQYHSLVGTARSRSSGQQSQPTRRLAGAPLARPNGRSVALFKGRERSPMCVQALFGLGQKQTSGPSEEQHGKLKGNKVSAFSV